MGYVSSQSSVTTTSPLAERSASSIAGPYPRAGTWRITFAPASSAMAAVRSVLESTIRTSASGTAALMSRTTLPTAPSSLRVIMATVITAAPHFFKLVSAR